MAEFGILGPLEVWAGSRSLDLGTAKQRTVLAVLLADAGHPVTVATLIDRLWDESPPAEARNVVYAHLSRIRRFLAEISAVAEPVTLDRRSGGYSLQLDLNRVDRHRFRRLVEQARAPIHDDAERAAILGEAIGLWRGEPLTGLGGAWAARFRETLRRHYLDAVSAWSQTELRLGRTAAVIDQLRDLTAEYPLAEHLTAALMRALHAAGRTAEALDCYGLTRQHLATDLGVDPGPELRALHQAMLRGDLPAPSTEPDVPKPSQLDVPAQLPPDVRGFTGRHAELNGLDTILDDAGAEPAATVIASLSGTAGVGKTALAVHWAHRVAARFPDGQLYLNLRGFDPDGAGVRPEDAVRGMLEALGVAPLRIPTGLAAQTALYRSLLAGRRMLIVLDNARNDDQVRPLLPGAPGCPVVVTSRVRLSGLVAIEGAYPIVLDVLDVAAARHLLAERIGADRIAAEPGAADDIIDRCARLPLALVVVAARAVTSRAFTLRALVDELDRVHSTLDAFDGPDRASDVRAVFSSSYHALTAAAARVFRLLGVHPGPHLATPAVASLAGAAAETVRPLLAELTDAHLLAEYRPGRYTFHDLLRAYATELAEAADSEQERAAAVQREVDHYLHTAARGALLLHPHADPVTLGPPAAGVEPEELADREAAFAWYTAEYQVLLGVLATTERSRLDVQTWQLAWACTEFLERQGKWVDLASIQQAALVAAERIGDQNGRYYAHRGLGLAYARLTRYDEAIKHLEEALAEAQAIGDHIGQARIHSNIGWALSGWGRHVDAFHHSRQALELYRAANHQTGEAHTLNSLGWYYAQSGDYAAAIVHCERALEIRAEIGDTVGQAATYDSLGYAYHLRGDQPAAIEAYLQALRLAREAGNRFDETETLTKLGDAYRASGDERSAHRVWRQALVALEELGHADADQVRLKMGQ